MIATALYRVGDHVSMYIRPYMCKCVRHCGHCWGLGSSIDELLTSEDLANVTVPGRSAERERQQLHGVLPVTILPFTHMAYQIEPAQMLMSICCDFVYSRGAFVVPRLGMCAGVGVRVICWCVFAPHALNVPQEAFLLASFTPLVLATTTAVVPAG